MEAYEIEYDMTRLNKAVKLYFGVSSKSEDEVIRKQSKNLDYDISKRLKQLAPERGSIRGEQVAAMKAIKGRGVHVRESVFQAVAEKYGLVPFKEGYLMRRPASGAESRRLSKFGLKAPAGAEHVKSVVVNGKRMNFRALAVMRELNVRESGIGFMSISTPNPSDSQGTSTTTSRYGANLSEFVLNTAASVEGKYALLRWLGGNGTALQGMSQAQQQGAITGAIQDRIDDMIKHVSDRVGFDIKAAGLI